MEDTAVRLGQQLLFGLCLNVLASRQLLDQTVLNLLVGALRLLESARAVSGPSGSQRFRQEAESLVSLHLCQKPAK